MNKILLGAGALIVVGLVVWFGMSRVPTTTLSSTPTPTSTATPVVMQNETPTPTQVGVDDFSNEVDSSTTLDSSIDTDVKQLDTDLKGL